MWENVSLAIDRVNFFTRFIFFDTHCNVQVCMYVLCILYVCMGTASLVHLHTVSLFENAKSSYFTDYRSDGFLSQFIVHGADTTEAISIAIYIYIHSCHIHINKYIYILYTRPNLYIYIQTSIFIHIYIYMYTCASSHSSVGVILFVCFPILKRLIDIYDLLNAGRRPRASGDVYMWRDVYLLIYIYICIHVYI